MISSNKIDYGYGHCPDPNPVVILAGSCPKKRASRRKFKETRHPVYRGVRQRNPNRWVCEIRTPNNKSKRIWLGTYPNPEMAARAHDVAALALRGPTACLNFADSAWRLPVPASATTRDIQVAATAAAEAFRPPESTSELSGGGYVDEEAVFDMPRLIANMAEGLLLPPPNSSIPYYGDLIWDEEESDCQVSLWSYSI